MTSNQIEIDLLKSGLTIDDIKARPLEAAERAACNVSAGVNGYAIPYYTIYGKALPFYRVKLFDNAVKYKQLKETPNHLYFPQDFHAKLLANIEKGQRYVIFTEGEKKAAAATKLGFPCVSVGGVDSWRNKILLLPKDAEINPYSYSKELISAKLPSSSWDTGGATTEAIAHGFEEFVALAIKHQLHILICYDSDDLTSLRGVKTEVQKAAAELGFEFRKRGIRLKHIRQMILPHLPTHSKTGLDDLLVTPEGPKQLGKLIQDTIAQRAAFPRHPNMEAALNKKLQNPKLSRQDIQHLTLMLITDLDSRGIRMFSQTESQLYFFESRINRLIKVDMSGGDNEISNTPFAKLLYQYYGISMASDTRVIKWLATQYAAEDPVEDVDPFRIIARDKTYDDSVKFQISDGEYIRVDANGWTVHHNGEDNVLFEAGHVKGADTQKLLAELEKRKAEPKLEMWWEDVLAEVRLKHQGKIGTLTALLYYVSPWLNRWRGTQLPAEIVVGEAGSGKSTLCELRLNILTGNPELRNAPTDLKDWHASIASTGGLHVTDNVQLIDKQLKQRLSDEMCRLITEPKPHIEMRKLYTNAELMHMKVDAVFCITAITQPFTQSDILQRSIILELDKLANLAKDEKVTYSADWKDAMMRKFGGREAWLSHHLYVLHKFFQAVEKQWKTGYNAKHRLINLEQSLMIMADIFGLENSWIPNFLIAQTDDAVVEADWTLEGIKEFARQLTDPAKKHEIVVRIGADQNLAKENRYTATSISNWAQVQEAYMECQNLVNPRKLGRYLQTHKGLIVQVANMYEGPKYANKITYELRPMDPKLIPKL